MNFSDLGHWIHSSCRLDRQKTLDWDEAGGGLESGGAGKVFWTVVVCCRL